MKKTDIEEMIKFVEEVLPIKEAKNFTTSPIKEEKDRKKVEPLSAEGWNSARHTILRALNEKKRS